MGRNRNKNRGGKKTSEPSNEEGAPANNTTTGGPTAAAAAVAAPSSDNNNSAPQNKKKATVDKDEEKHSTKKLKQQRKDLFNEPVAPAVALPSAFDKDGPILVCCVVNGMQNLRLVLPPFKQTEQESGMININDNDQVDAAKRSSSGDNNDDDQHSSGSRNNSFHHHSHTGAASADEERSNDGEGTFPPPPSHTAATAPSSAAQSVVNGAAPSTPGSSFSAAVPSPTNSSTAAANSNSHNKQQADKQWATASDDGQHTTASTTKTTIHQNNILATFSGAVEPCHKFIQQAPLRNGRCELKCVFVTPCAYQPKPKALPPMPDRREEEREREERRRRRIMQMAEGTNNSAAAGFHADCDGADSEASSENVSQPSTVAAREAKEGKSDAAATAPTVIVVDAAGNGQQRQQQGAPPQPAADEESAAAAAALREAQQPKIHYSGRLIIDETTTHELGPLQQMPAVESAVLVDKVPKTLRLEIRAQRVPQDHPSERLLADHCLAILETDEYLGSVSTSHLQNQVRDLPFYDAVIGPIRASWSDFIRNHLDLWDVFRYSADEITDRDISKTCRTKEHRIVARRHRDSYEEGDMVRNAIHISSERQLHDLLMERLRSRSYEQSELLAELIHEKPFLALLTPNISKILAMFEEQPERYFVLQDRLHPILVELRRRGVVDDPRFDTWNNVPAPRYSFMRSEDF